MKALNCKGCGAPIVPSGARLVECGHCGSLYEMWEGPELPASALKNPKQIQQVSAYSYNSTCGAYSGTQYEIHFDE